MTDHISTKLTRLQLLIDWTSCTNLSPTNLFSLTSPSSPLLLSPFVDFSTPFTPYYNPSCLYLNIKRDILSGHYAVILSSVGIMEQSFKQ